MTIEDLPPLPDLTDADIDLHAEELLGFKETNGGRVWYVDGATVAKADLRAFVRNFVELEVGRSSILASRQQEGRDAARLDWIEARWRDAVHIECCAANSGLTHQGLHPVATVYVGGRDGIEGSNIRAAIDAAISAEGKS